MRIIDKQKDFYDFYQGMYRDDSIVFDRTDSFELTKKIFCEHLQYGYHRNRFYLGQDRPQEIFVLLQVCNTFWLFMVDVTKTTSYDTVKDYTIELITCWKNYNKMSRLIKLDIIEFGFSIYALFKYRVPDKQKLLSKINDLTRMIDDGDFKIIHTIDRHTIRKDGGEQIEKHIPLLKSSGMAQCIFPLDIYLAFEEYFSLEKSSKERKESVGLTNNEKVENHGFDLKKSFRGKQ